jgi:four helix bundle protein
MIDRFEEIEAWQKARELSKVVCAVTGEGAFSRDFGLRDQVRRAAVSVMSNIAEGFNRGENRELVQFLFIAKGSATEVQAQLYVALDAGYLKSEQFEQLHKLAGDAGRLICGFIRYLKAHNSKLETRNS